MSAIVLPIMIVLASTLSFTTQKIELLTFISIASLALAILLIQFVVLSIQDKINRMSAETVSKGQIASFGDLSYVKRFDIKKDVLVKYTNGDSRTYKENLTCAVHFNSKGEPAKIEIYQEGKLMKSEDGKDGKLYVAVAYDYSAISSRLLYERVEFNRKELIEQSKEHERIYEGNFKPNFIKDSNPQTIKDKAKNLVLGNAQKFANFSVSVNLKESEISEYIKQEPHISR